MSINCLEPRSFTSLNAYHNDVAILSINELVADLHRHEDFIGVDRSEILGSTADDVTAELISFNFGKTAIVNVLSLISLNLINLIGVTVDGYAWCDPDENPYSGRDTIDGDVTSHLWWVSIIGDIRDILQQLICKCSPVDIELPPGRDIIFRTGNIFDLTTINESEGEEYFSTGATNAEAHAGLSAGICSENFYRSLFYEAAIGSFNSPDENCHERLGGWGYHVGTLNNSPSRVHWIGDNSAPQPGDIPFELVSSRFEVSAFYRIHPGSEILGNNSLSMNITIKINNIIVFSGEISVHDPEYFPQGPPTEIGRFDGVRITNGHWGLTSILPGNILLHSGQDLLRTNIDVSSLPILEKINLGEDLFPSSKTITLKHFELWIKARRPA